MGVYIKGMKMPKACVYRENGHLTTCPLYDINGYCGALNTEASHNEGGKLPSCPLVPITPHGRLIDADALAEHTKTEWFCGNKRINVPWKAVTDAPTIIPTVEGE